MMPDPKIDPYDIGALERSVNDSATRFSAIWLSFVAFSAYLGAAASMITHRQIFLEEPIKLPTINVELPLFASVILLPLLFVVYHVYVLLQAVLLARTADAYNDAIERNLADEPDRTRIRQRLANTLLAQLFAGSSREKTGVFGWLLRGMAWITLAIAPITVLIIFETKLLPYHSAAVSWTHRGLIAFDALAVLMLWASAVNPQQDIGWRSLVRNRRLSLAVVAVLVLSNLLITYPGEPGRFWMKLTFTPDPTSNIEPECQIYKAVEDRIPPGFDRLVLLGQDFVDNSAFDRIKAVAATNGQNLYESERIRIFRGRDLRCARLAGADLRLADFSEANLSGAILRGALLEGARFVGARIVGAVLDRAQLQESAFSQPPAVADEDEDVPATRSAMAAKPGAKDAKVSPRLAPARLRNSSFHGAQMRRAFLDHVNLDGADLRVAQLEQASLVEASLRGAALMDAGLGDAKLDRAKLQGASFDRGSLAGASLISAEMQGVSLHRTWMLGANLDSAIMHGASFTKTQLEGTTFYQTELQGARFEDVRFEGTSFIRAQLQGVQMKGGLPYTRALRDSFVINSFLWRADNLRCDTAYVSSPNFEALIEARDDLDKPVRVAATDQAISDFIARSLAGVPEAANAAVVNFSRAELRDRLTARLKAPPPASPAPGEEAWKSCASQSKSYRDNGFQSIVQNIADFACARRSIDINRFATAFATGSAPPSRKPDGTFGPDSLWATQLLPVGDLFAKSFLAASEPKCRNAKDLNDATKELLRYLVDPDR